MTFKDYYLLKESYIGELAAKYDNIDISGIQHWANKMYDYCIDWSIRESLPNNQLRKKCEQSIKKLFTGIKKYQAFAIQTLYDLHELEYKQGQVKKFYGNDQEILRQIDNTLLKISKWLQAYLSVILFSRACGDVVQYDKNNEGIKQDVQTTIKKLILSVSEKLRMNVEMYNNYVTPIFVELYHAKTLSQLLIAITKAKNAEHDGGKIMTEWGTGLFHDNEAAFNKISNLNYRKLDKELQQELNG